MGKGKDVDSSLTIPRYFSLCRMNATTSTFADSSTLYIKFGLRMG